MFTSAAEASALVQEELFLSGLADRSGSGHLDLPVLLARLADTSPSIRPTTSRMLELRDELANPALHQSAASASLMRPLVNASRWADKFTTTADKRR